MKGVPWRLPGGATGATAPGCVFAWTSLNCFPSRPPNFSKDGLYRLSSAAAKMHGLSDEARPLWDEVLASNGD